MFLTVAMASLVCVIFKPSMELLQLSGTKQCHLLFLLLLLLLLLSSLLLPFVCIEFFKSSTEQPFAKAAAAAAAISVAFSLCFRAFCCIVAGKVTARGLLHKLMLGKENTLGWHLS